MNEKMELLNDLITLQQTIHRISDNKTISKNDQACCILEELEKILSEAKRDSMKFILYEILSFSVLDELNKKIELTMEEIKKDLDIPIIGVSTITCNPGWNNVIPTPCVNLNDLATTGSTKATYVEPVATKSKIDTASDYTTLTQGLRTGDQPIITSVTTSTTEPVNDYTKALQEYSSISMKNV